MKGAQRSTMKVLVLLSLAGWFLMAGWALAASEEYPSRPVTINLGMAPGGAGSVGAHIFAEGVQKYLSKPQPFIVNHKPGASGMLSFDYVMKQPVDGYNLLWITADIPLRMALEPHKFSFTLKDLSYIGHFAYTPFFLGVRSESSFQTMEDFIDYAKKHPGEMTNALTGIGAGNHLTAELLMREAGIKLTHVPFPAGTQATLAMLGGHVTCTIMSAGTFGAHIKPGGKARALVVFDSKRFPELPDVPTCREKGYNVERVTYFVLAAKKGTPKPILDTLVKLFTQTSHDPGVQASLGKAGFVPRPMNPEESEKFIVGDYEMARDVFEKLGLAGK